MKIGDRVRVIGVPDPLPPDGDVDDLNTTRLFRSCVGRIFSIAGFNDEGYVELEVGEVIGQAPYMSSIWIEPRHLAPVAE
jgi:hypothetical protein